MLMLFNILILMTKSAFDLYKIRNENYSCCSVLKILRDADNVFLWRKHTHGDVCTLHHSSMCCRRCFVPNHWKHWSDGSRTAWVVSIVSRRRTPWVVAQMWRGSRRSLPNQSRQPSAFSPILMHFQWDGLNTAVSTPVDRFCWLIPHVTPVGNFHHTILVFVRYGCLTVSYNPDQTLLPFIDARHTLPSGRLADFIPKFWSVRSGLLGIIMSEKINVDFSHAFDRQG